MKTSNDVLADFIRANFPEIEKSFPFAIYRAEEAMKGLAKSIFSVAKDKEENYEPQINTLNLSDDVSVVYAIVRTSEGRKAIYHAERCIKKQSEGKEGIQSSEEHKGHSYKVWENLGEGKV